MPGRGPAPTENRRRRNEPARGDWKPAEGAGWQHGPVPSPPTKMTKATRDAWQAWFTAWYAAHWTEDMLPGLRQVARLYDACERGALQRHSELRMAMDTYGMTPKGQQDRRWKAPPKEKPETSEAKVVTGRWGDLKVADGA